MPGFTTAIDSTLDIYAHRHRRYALECLERHDDPLTLADLADEVAIRDHGKPLQNIPADAVKDIYLSLYHWHVPKLVDARLVKYDQHRDLVRQALHDDAVETYRAKITVDGDGYLDGRIDPME